MNLNGKRTIVERNIYM